MRSTDRGSNDGQEIPQRGIQPIDEVAVYAARPTMRGERDEYGPVRGVLGHGEDVIALAEAYRDRLGCRFGRGLF